MKKLTLTAAVLTASIRLALAADPAALSIVVFDQGQPVPRTEVVIDGAPQGVTDDYGSARIQVAAGSRELILRSEGREVLKLDLEFAEGENAELIASLQADAPTQVQYESSESGRGPVTQATVSDTPAAPPGTLSGRVVSSEGGVAIANARVFVSGTPLDIRTDADGRFTAQIPAGTYSVSVIAAEFDSRTLSDIAVVAEQTTQRDFEITPAGLELPEFVVLEPYIEGSLTQLVEERRETASVADFLGAAQIARAGDSDAAGALKRVTGLTLVDGKYIYVRGLGERYSSVLLNGAQIPSPDPTRRVVPLDLFPTDVIETVLVQKTYSSEMPGEFGGGTIVLRTRNAPDSFFAKLGVTTGYLDGTTGADGFTYSGGSRDWSGYDSGARAPQGDLATALGTGRRVTQQANSFTAEQLEPIGEALALNSSYTPREKRIEPKYGFSGGIGQTWELGGVRLGFLASLRYDNTWDVNEEQRSTYTGESVTLNDRFEVDTTTQNIELSGFANLSAQFGEDHALRGNVLLARVTEDEVQIQDGTADSQDLRRYKLEWVENQLRSSQLGGEHRFPFLANLEATWLYTQSQASRDEPNRRTYAYQVSPDGTARLRNTPAHTFASLVDDAEGYDLGLKLPLALFGERLALGIGAGVSDFQRDRDNRLRSFEFSGLSTVSDRFDQPLERILTAMTLRPGGVEINESTQPSENYVASQRIEAIHLGIDLHWDQRYRLALGLREESDSIELTPQRIGSGGGPLVPSVDRQQDDRLPYAMATWKFNDDNQLRLGYSKTLSRPDFRELSLSPFTDPQLDILFFGNPDLRTTQLRNYDLRFEHYFSASESASVAVFRKEFTDPIEKSQLPGGSGAQGELINAQSAILDGIEFDIYKQLDFVERWSWPDRIGLGGVDWDNVYVSANYAYLKSDIVLGAGRCREDNGFLTSCERPLQGQSPYAANLQFGYANPDSGREYSLLYNRFGARIAQIGVDGAPDIYEQPFNQLDAVFQQKFWDDWSLKLRLRNLLDPEVQFLQGDRPTRTYKKGREILLTLEWKL